MPLGLPLFPCRSGKNPSTTPLSPTPSSHSLPEIRLRCTEQHRSPHRHDHAGQPQANMRLPLPRSLQPERRRCNDNNGSCVTPKSPHPKFLPSPHLALHQPCKANHPSALSWPLPAAPTTDRYQTRIHDGNPTRTHRHAPPSQLRRGAGQYQTTQVPSMQPKFKSPIATTDAHFRVARLACCPLTSQWEVECPRGGFQGKRAQTNTAATAANKTDCRSTPVQEDMVRAPG